MKKVQILSAVSYFYSLLCIVNHINCIFSVFKILTATTKTLYSIVKQSGTLPISRYITEEENKRRNQWGLSWLMWEICTQLQQTSVICKAKRVFITLSVPATYMTYFYTIRKRWKVRKDWSSPYPILCHSSILSLYHPTQNPLRCILLPCLCIVV